MSRRPFSAGRRQRGATAPEFAIVAVIFFTVLFGAFEVARALYLWSTLAEVVGRTARLASVTAPRDEALARQRAMFRNAAGKLPLSSGIDPSYLRIDYLAADRTTRVAAPACPLQNMINCTNDPTGPSCIRYVQARLCEPGTDCTRVMFEPIVGLLPLQSLKIPMPSFETVAPAESLGLPDPCTP